MLNLCAIEGFVASDATQRRLPDGKYMTRIRIGHTRKRRNAPPDVMYVSCVFYGMRADYAKRYCAIGSEIIVRGRLRMAKIDDPKHLGQKKDYFYLDNCDFDFVECSRKEPQTEEDKKLEEQERAAAAEADDLVDDSLPY